jgi:hypothetical protein
LNILNRSLKSGFAGIVLPSEQPGLGNHFPGRCEPPFRADRLPEGTVKRTVLCVPANQPPAHGSLPVLLSLHNVPP